MTVAPTNGGVGRAEKRLRPEAVRLTISALLGALLALGLAPLVPPLAEGAPGPPANSFTLVPAYHRVPAKRDRAATLLRNQSSGGFVGYPSFLPKSTLDVPSDRVLVGTADHPAFTSEGDTIKVVTPRWSVLIVVRGPEVPGEGLPYQAPATTCTWTVVLSRATDPVPISVSDFNTIDDDGFVYHPYLVPGQPALPPILEPGQTVTFELRTTQSTGEGIMRWAPGGKQIVAKWDFIVEND